MIRLKEVELLRKAAAKKEREDAVGLRDEINALCRGAVVLLSSHVEAYVRETGEIALDAFFKKKVNRAGFSPRTFYHISKDVIDEVKDTSDHSKIAEKVFAFIASDITYWSQSGPFNSPISSERFNKGFSNPKFDKVRAYFNRFGYEDFSKDFNATLKADAQTTKNMLNHLVDLRNGIAHGDQSATKTPADLKEMIKLISLFCRTTDVIFSGWCKKTFCSIK